MAGAARSVAAASEAESSFAGALLSPRWRSGEVRALRGRMRRLARALVRAYGTPDLGNVPDPLDEAVYIVLTYQTDIGRARSVWADLKGRFPSWSDVLDAPVAELEVVLAPSGLQRARAKLIRQLLEAVRLRWGTLSLDTLRTMGSAQAEAELRALPGLDIKGARCVLLYSLQRPVFPVDSNTFRFMQRYGVVAPSARYRRKATHDGLQALVAPADRHALHVNLVAHGQRTCLPKKPLCEACPVRRSCAVKHGNRADGRGPARPRASPLWPSS